jgi:phosphate acetyltransferase/phosphate butyryltransferase
LIARTEALPPLRVAVVHPVERDSLLAVRDAVQANLISPILVGPRARIEAAARAEGIDVSRFTLISTEHSHAAAAKAVQLARTGQVEALLKGALPLSELMDEVQARDTGLRTGRRMSQVSVMDVPTYPRPLFITDTGLNVYPNLTSKRDIVQNAIDLAQALGIETPKVAVLSTVETIDPDLPSGLEAAALCKMVERKQIRGGIIDGPLAFDDAISPEAAGRKQINSPVAGQADILVAPDLETGTMLVKQLNYLAEAETTDIILGARIPIALTGHAANALARAAPCAVALLLARDTRRTHGPLSRLS